MSVLRKAEVEKPGMREVEEGRGKKMQVTRRSIDKESSDYEGILE